MIENRMEDGTIGLVMRITPNRECMELLMNDRRENYRKNFSLSILQEQSSHVIVGDLIEFVVNPENSSSQMKLGRIRGRSVPNRFHEIWSQMEQPSISLINDDTIRNWNNYAYFERAALDRFILIFDNKKVDKINWLQEGF